MKPQTIVSDTALVYTGFSDRTNVVALTSLALPETTNAYPSLARFYSISRHIKNAVQLNTISWLLSHHLLPERLALARQVHGSRVKYVTEPGIYSDIDGFVTDCTNLHLTIRTADCAAVMIAMPQVPLIGIAHAGWRGIRSDIVKNLVDLMLRHSGEAARNASVVVSPHIKGCCYEVGREFEQYFPAQFLQHREGRLFFDMEKALVHQLTETGVHPEQILISPYCTACSALPLYSYRKQKTTKRLYNIITIKGGNS